MAATRFTAKRWRFSPSRAEPETDLFCGFPGWTEPPFSFWSASVNNSTRDGKQTRSRNIFHPKHARVTFHRGDRARGSDAPTRSVSREDGANKTETGAVQVVAIVTLHSEGNGRLQSSFTWSTRLVRTLVSMLANISLAAGWLATPTATAPEPET